MSGCGIWVSLSGRVVTVLFNCQNQTETRLRTNTDTDNAISANFALQLRRRRQETEKEKIRFPRRKCKALMLDGSQERGPDWSVGLPLFDRISRLSAFRPEKSGRRDPVRSVNAPMVSAFLETMRLSVVKNLRNVRQNRKVLTGYVAVALQRVVGNLPSYETLKEIPGK